jgi:3-hydroxybutyryl-CoA dehydratase
MRFKEGQPFEMEFIVSEEIYTGFMRLFKDRNPLHTDEIFAVSKGFKGVVMYGNILNGFLSYFIGEGLPEKNVIIHSQKIDYKKPVYLNDALTLRAQVDEIHESVKAVLLKYSFNNHANETVAKGLIQIGVLS